MPTRGAYLASYAPLTQACAQTEDDDFAELAADAVLLLKRNTVSDCLLHPGSLTVYLMPCCVWRANIVSDCLMSF